VAEIIEARCEEVFKMIDKELRAVDRSGKLPAGIVLTGAGAKLPDIVEVAKQVFRLPVSLGVTNIKTVIDKAADPAFSTAVGLVVWGTLVQPARKIIVSTKKISNFLKKIFKGLIP